jgi:hypothetical protein
MKLIKFYHIKVMEPSIEDYKWKYKTLKYKAKIRAQQGGSIATLVNEAKQLIQTVKPTPETQTHYDQLLNIITTSLPKAFENN